MNIKTASKKGIDSFMFCLERGILGFGWPLKDVNGKKIKDIEEYEKLGKIQYKSKGLSTAINAFKKIEIDDLVWTRHQGIYYLCRVEGKWRYESDNANYDADVVNVIPVKFIKVGTVENVPGKVVNAFRARSTIQKIHGYKKNNTYVNPALILSMKIYNEKSKTEYYEVPELDKNDILESLLPEDVEEIVSLYLQYEKNYLLYSSSNKIDTQKYEFVMVSRDGTHLAYAQVKTGNVLLDGREFEHLLEGDNKIYLFTSSENYKNINNDNIKIISKNDLINFLYNNLKIMPNRIRMWL